MARSSSAARIGWRLDAEAVEVRQAHRAVVGDNEVLEPCTEVTDVDGEPPQDLALHAGGELPVGVRTLVPPGQRVWVVAGAGARAPEVGIRHRAALGIGRRVEQLAVRYEVAVCVGPGSRRRVDETRRRIHVRGVCRIRARAAGIRCAVERQILVEADFQRRLAIAKRVVRRTGPRLQVVPRDALRLREGEIAVRRERTRAHRLLGKRNMKVVVTESARHGQLFHGPPILDEGSMIALVDQRPEGRGQQRQLIGHAVVEPEARWRIDAVRFLVLALESEVEARLEIVRSGDIGGREFRLPHRIL